MEPVFLTFDASRPYIVFKQHMTCIGLFLPQDTVIHFSALSRYFNNLLNNPKSDFGWMFWKTLAVKNGGIKSFKGKRINYKFKLMRKRLDSIKNDIRLHKVPRWRSFVTCQKCARPCFPDEFEEFYYDASPNRFCNCEFVKCESKFEIIEKSLTISRQEIVNRKKELMLQLDRLNKREKVVEQKLVKLKSFNKMEPMIAALKSMKKNARYKSTRTQAERALDELDFYKDWKNPVRRNANYKAPPLGVAGLLPGVRR